MAKTVKPGGLGRGLSALMSDVAPPAQVAASPNGKASDTVSDLKRVNINDLVRNPDQPRTYFDKSKLADLAASIRDRGILQPILVRPLEGAESFQIVAGERRWQAALQAGLDSVPVIVREFSDREVLEIGVVENVQRANLNPVEEARAYHALTQDFDRTHADIAKAVGKSRTHVTNTLRLLSLPENAQDLLIRGEISAGHARAVLASRDPNGLMAAILDHNLSVRGAEDWNRDLGGRDVATSARRSKPTKSADIRKLETLYSERHGLRVDINPAKRGGKVVLHYRTVEEFEAISDLLKH